MKNSNKVKQKNASLLVNKGWGSLYVILLLNFTFVFLTYQTQRLLALKHLSQLDFSYEEVEIIAIRKIKDDYFNYQEEDTSLTYQGKEITFDYEGMTVLVEVNDGSKVVRFQVEYDDIDNCITKFEYLRE